MKDRSETYLVHLSEDDKATYLPNHVPSVLTPREREVLEVIAEGHGSKAAGERHTLANALWTSTSLLPITS